MNNNISLSTKPSNTLSQLWLSVYICHTFLLDAGGGVGGCLTERCQPNLNQGFKLFLSKVQIFPPEIDS